MSKAYLHLLLLAHLQRFFGAARRAGERLGGDELEELVGLTGNLLFASSSRVARSPAQQHAMAIVGGAMARGQTMGFTGGPGTGGGGSSRARTAFDELERELLAGMDTLVATFAAELEAAGLAEASPAALDAWIWRRLFPGYPWPAGQGELEEAIAARCR